MSADDEFSDSSIITKIVDSFNKRKCSILVTARWFCDEELNSKKLQPMKLEQYYIEKKYTTSNSQLKAAIFEEFFDVLAGSTLYMTKEFFKKIGGFDESYRLLEDWPFFTDYTSQYTIDFDFSIISIKYRSGGVSHSGKGNKILIPDLELFNNTTRIRYKDLLDPFSQSKLEYTIKRTKVKRKDKVLILWLMHPFVMCSKVYYKLIRLVARISDRFL